MNPTAATCPLCASAASLIWSRPNFQLYQFPLHAEELDRVLVRTVSLQHLQLFSPRSLAAAMDRAGHLRVERMDVPSTAVIIQRQEDFQGYIDSDPRKVGDRFASAPGLPIVSPEQAATRGVDAVVIASFSVDEICRAMRALGWHVDVSDIYSGHVRRSETIETPVEAST